MIKYIVQKTQQLPARDQFDVFIVDDASRRFLNIPRFDQDVRTVVAAIRNSYVP